jgi:hypothetical protein
VRDADPTTDEITVTNLIDEDVVVDRCLIVAGNRTSCTPFATIAPGNDLLTVENVAASPKADHQALVIRVPSDVSQSYQRDLVTGAGAGVSGASCQIERILVHGRRLTPVHNPPIGGAVALSSCYGYASGGSF